MRSNSFSSFGLTFNNYRRERQDESLFNGKSYDNRTSWYDFGARMYSADIDRWHNADPLAALAMNWTPYRFGFNNPITFIDPTGLQEERPGEDGSEMPDGTEWFGDYVDRVESGYYGWGTSLAERWSFEGYQAHQGFIVSDFERAKKIAQSQRSSYRYRSYSVGVGKDTRILGYDLVKVPSAGSGWSWYSSDANLAIGKAWLAFQAGFNEFITVYDQVYTFGWGDAMESFGHAWKKGMKVFEYEVGDLGVPTTGAKPTYNKFRNQSNATTRQKPLNNNGGVRGWGWLKVVYDMAGPSVKAAESILTPVPPTPGDTLYTNGSKLWNGADGIRYMLDLHYPNTDTFYYDYDEKKFFPIK